MDTDNSTDGTDATRTLGILSVDLRIHIHDHPQCGGNTQDTPRRHRDASGCLKDAPDGYTDLAETRGD